MDEHAVVAEQVESAVELDGLVFAGHAAADAVAEHQEILSDEEHGVAWRGPERIPDLVTLIDERRVQEFADVAGMIDMEVPKHDILYVRGLDVDLAQLGIDRDIRRAARV